MAIEVTPGDIATRFPEFSAVPSATIQQWIDEALCNVNECQWDKRGTFAVELLTAHYLTTFSSPDCAEPAAGPVSSEREGQIAVTYAVADRFKDDALGSTKYGRQFLTLRKRIFVTRKI